MLPIILWLCSHICALVVQPVPPVYNWGALGMSYLTGFLIPFAPQVS